VQLGDEITSDLKTDGKKGKEKKKQNYKQFVRAKLR